MVGLKQGSILYLDFSPQSGHEQSGRRPAIVVSNDLYNAVSSLVMVCPITHTNKKRPFNVPLDSRTKTDGYILCDQVRMVDGKSRNAVYIEAAPPDILNEVIDIISGIIEH